MVKQPQIMQPQEYSDVRPNLIQNSQAVLDRDILPGKPFFPLVASSRHCAVEVEDAALHYPTRIDGCRVVRIGQYRIDRDGSTPRHFKLRAELKSDLVTRVCTCTGAVPVPPPGPLPQIPPAGAGISGPPEAPAFRAARPGSRTRTTHQVLPTWLSRGFQNDLKV